MWYTYISKYSINRRMEIVDMINNYDHNQHSGSVPAEVIWEFIERQGQKR